MYFLNHIVGSDDSFHGLCNTSAFLTPGFFFFFFFQFFLANFRRYAQNSTSRKRRSSNVLKISYISDSIPSSYFRGNLQHY